MENASYTVNPDCTGNTQINFPTPPHGTSGAVITLMFVTADEGRTIHATVTGLTPPNTITPVPANIHSDAPGSGRRSRRRRCTPRACALGLPARRPGAPLSSGIAELNVMLGLRLLMKMLYVQIEIALAVWT